ncbi:50S ribosomal protein L6 [Gammaproteobacteria bacterium]|nr:50S ribosomal protein L6 [Gammaproteobacteria bacterium]
MSRIASRSIEVPKGTEVKIEHGLVTVKGSKSETTSPILPGVVVEEVDGRLVVTQRQRSKQASMNAGTTRALLNNSVIGASAGFERKLQIIGVGYRAQAQGKALNLSLGFSHPVVFDVPEGITVETPSQTEILVKGSDKQLVGQVAANIRSYRPPEPYKGKGVRYADEHVVRKQAKKK